MAEHQINIFPSEFAKKIGLNYSNITSDLHKKSSGQFFTPKLIADYMGKLAQSKSDYVSILDNCCGMAILSCCLIENLIEEGQITKIDLQLSNMIKERYKVISFLKIFRVPEITNN